MLKTPIRTIFVVGKMNSIGDVDNKLPTETSNKTGDESYSNGKEIEMNSNLKKMPKFKIDSDGDFYFVLSILPYLKRVNIFDIWINLI